MDRHHDRDHRTAYGASLRYLIETDVGAQRTLGGLQFSSPAGTCYRAANWLDVGRTTGRGRQNRDHTRHNAPTKRIFLYPLRADAREALSADP